jgi:hypothetical protein
MVSVNPAYLYFFGVEVMLYWIGSDNAHNFPTETLWLGEA